MDVPWDAVHAHASDNTIDGLNEFDGSFGGHLFHGDPGLAWHGLWAGVATSSNGLQWSLMVSNGLQWSPMVSNGLQWSIHTTNVY